MNQTDPQALDERAVGLLVRHQLNASLSRLPTRSTERLFEARQRALGRQRVHLAALSAPGFGQVRLGGIGELLRPVLMAGILIAALTAGNQFVASQHQENQEDIDAALLSDELPISAYLDNGFQSWLADSSRH